MNGKGFELHWLFFTDVVVIGDKDNRYFPFLLSWRSLFYNSNVPLPALDMIDHVSESIDFILCIVKCQRRTYGAFNSEAS